MIHHNLPPKKVFALYSLLSKVTARKELSWPGGTNGESISDYEASIIIVFWFS